MSQQDLDGAWCTGPEWKTLLSETFGVRARIFNAWKRKLHQIVVDNKENRSFDIREEKN
jgi:phospholipase C